jgi:2-polyprenyl-6-methoxyphenol hydroxylase-like FAD-dependent oxidoreductase
MGRDLKHYDLIVVGGGIGGSALATVMARADRSVLVLEKSEVFEDQVRGEWIAPWGVTEVKRLGLLDLLLGAGGHFVAKHITYDEHVVPSEAEAGAIPLNIFAPDVPGPLCIGHPHHCQTLYDEAGRVGAQMLRGVDVLEVKAGENPSVTYTTADGERGEATARLLVGADGRNSMVREALGITLHADKPHHMFGGMLVEGADGWDVDLQAIGTEGDFAFLAFPQGGGKVRVYGSYSLDERSRFAGPDGARRFLDSFAGRPAGPLRSYANNDTWTDEPFVQGAVLVGDAAGWNDPIIGLGLSITYRDVRMVSDLLLGSDDWSPALLKPYAEERYERMRRLRFTASLVSELDAEFGDGPSERRTRYHKRLKEDPMLGLHTFAVLAGPENAPPEVFTQVHRGRVLGLETAA